MRFMHEIKKKGGPDLESKQKERADPRRAKVPMMPSIRQALSEKQYGFIFTTPRSDDIYVITHGTWGDKSKDKVVKSFKPDTPFREIVGYSDRTKSKHGGKSLKKPQGKVEKEKEERGFATKGKSKEDLEKES